MDDKIQAGKKKTDFVFCQVDLGFFLVCLGFLEIRIVIHFGGYEDSVFASSNAGLFSQAMLTLTLQE